MPAARIAAALILCLLSPLPAAAFDCSRATTDVEKAICASPVAKEADDRMARAYRELKAALPPDQARALLDSQRQWVTSRENRCNWRTDQERTRCVIDETAKRWRILAGLPEAGPGTGAARLQPLVIARQGNAKAYSIDISVVLFAHPGSRGERVFNRAVRALYADALLNEEIDFESPGELSYNLAVEVTYASPDFISALASGWRYDGGAHGNSWTRAVNVDLKHGRLIGFADVFARSARGAFSRRCRKQLIAQKRDKMGEGASAPASDLREYRKTITDHIADLSRWSFRGKHAEVLFDPYAVGSYAEGEYTCRFDNRMIRRYARPGAALPR